MALHHCTTTLVPIVGGWRALMERESLNEDEALGLMRTIVGRFRGKTASLVLRLEEVTWTDLPVLNAYLGGRLVGSVAPEHAERVYERVDEPVDALVSVRGRTVYAVLMA